MTAHILWRAGDRWRDLADDVVRKGVGPRHVALVTANGTRHQLDFYRRRWSRTPAGGGPDERRRVQKIEFVTPCGARIVEDSGHWWDTSRVLLAAVGELDDGSWAEAAAAAWDAPGHPPQACPAAWCPHGGGPADHVRRIVAWREAR